MEAEVVMKEAFNVLKRNAFEEVLIERQVEGNGIDENLGIFVPDDQVSDFIKLIAKESDDCVTHDLKLALSKSNDFKEMLFYMGVLMKIKQKNVIKEIIETIKCASFLPEEAKMMLMIHIIHGFNQ